MTVIKVGLRYSSIPTISEQIHSHELARGKRYKICSKSGGWWIWMTALDCRKAFWSEICFLCFGEKTH